jgi:hypothetical protein
MIHCILRAALLFIHLSTDLYNLIYQSINYILNQEKMKGVKLCFRIQ